jgi:predicted metal-binding protein
MKEAMERALEAAEKASGIDVYQRGTVPVSALVFSPDLYLTCRTNTCGHYNKSWTCPPGAGTLEEQRKQILAYQNVMVFTTKHELEDSFDYEGMTEGRERHTRLTLCLRKCLGDGFPVYGAGSCPSCRKKNLSVSGEDCAFPAPCRRPEKKIGSIEAAGINVTELSKAASISYHNGPNTVTYFSMVLWSLPAPDYSAVTG